MMIIILWLTLGPPKPIAWGSHLPPWVCGLINYPVKSITHIVTQFIAVHRLLCKPLSHGKTLCFHHGESVITRSVDLLAGGRSVPSKKQGPAESLV